jgi:hypothetical protein
MTGEFVLQEVERTGQAFAEAREALRMACVRAVDRGAAQGEVAAVGGVHPDTVHAWVIDQGRTSARQVRGDAPLSEVRSRPKDWIDYTGASA